MDASQAKLVSICVCLILSLANWTHAQGNISTKISATLEECYNEPHLFQRDNWLPMTINTLIEIIRKVENSGPQQDMRQLAISLVHRFRLDGIERDYRGKLPFKPIGQQISKQRLLLSRLIPGNAINFPNNTLTALEQCTLHFMMSSSFDLHVGNDVCNQLVQPRLKRESRDANLHYQSDEMFEDHFFAQIESIPEVVISKCPVENGVIRTQWGSIAVGPLISGIAAGLEPQNVTIRELLIFSQEGNEMVAEQNLNLSIDNRWAATLAGDLAEVALYQGPIRETMNVGAPGAWNGTAVPKWYFLSRNENLQMTDAEIRGGLDGLILAQHIWAWRQQMPTLRLSQVLEMYYSDHGVFDVNIRACKRFDLFPLVAPVAMLQDQTAAFSIVLEKEARTPVTISQAYFITLANAASARLSAYIPQLNTDSCTIMSGQIAGDGKV